MEEPLKVLLLRSGVLSALPAVNGKTIRILVVDSEPGQQVLKNQLTLQNYQVSSAMNGRRPSILDSGEHFDLVLLDIMMPRMSNMKSAARSGSAFFLRSFQSL
ncbi:MAG: hypothetical protein R3B47_12935 [Bacteroidia bacterium]